jgi:sortase A
MNRIRLTPRCVTMLMVCLLTIGTWQVGEGAWIYAKAGLAQWLLQRAWSRSLAGGVAAKPWPWADTWPVARLIVPSQNIDQIVLEGAYGRTLAFGPGHAESNGGMDNPGTSILTGHRDTHFRFLQRLKAGDEILFTTRNQRPHRFRVSSITVVDAGTASIRQDTQENQLALVTCYPFDAISAGGPLRYVVMAEEEE